MKNAIISWSGGKDCALAMYRAKEKGISPVALLTMVDSNHYSRSNGIPMDILKAQAKAMQLPIFFVKTTWQNYEKKIIKSLRWLKNQYQATVCVFGDGIISAHKKVEEQIGQKAGLISVLPLQNLTTDQIKNDLIALNIKSRISVVNKKLPIHSILSKAYHLLDFAELKRLNIDLCGENGEFYTILYDALFLQHL